MLSLFYLTQTNGARSPGFKSMKVEYIVIMLTAIVISTTNGPSRVQNGNNGGRKEKVKLTLCLIKQNAIRVCGGVELGHHPFLLSA